MNEPEEHEKLIRSLGPHSKVILLTNHGALCCGETIEEAFYNSQHMVKAAEAQVFANSTIVKERNIKTFLIIAESLASRY